MAQVRVQQEELTPSGAPLVIRRVRVRGSNVEIGRAMAELAVERYGLRAEDLLADGRYVRARRNYFQRNYPIHWQRMRGVAATLGFRADDDRFDFSIVRTSPSGSAADVLTAVASYVPPWLDERRHGLLRRSVTLPTQPAGPVELYLMEWHPPGAAHASVALHAYDLLSGTLAGINSRGLAVATVAGGDPRGVEHQPGSAGAVGLHELQLMRFVLDACTTVDDAQAALLGTRDFTLLTSARYLIADQSGRSFVYQPVPTAQTILDGRAEARASSPGRARSMRSTERSLTTPTSTATEVGYPVPSVDKGERCWECVADQERRDLEVRIGGGDEAPEGSEAGCFPAARIV